MLDYPMTSRNVVFGSAYFESSIVYKQVKAETERKSSFFQYKRYTKLPIKTSPLLRLNGISPYFTMFPLDFPLKQLLKARAGEWVLDPFCGRGTTNYAARLLGLPSVGVDSNMVAVATAAAKMVDVKAIDIIELCASILSRSKEPIDVPKGRFWDLCYHRDTLRQICILREELLRDCSSDERIALRALLMGILHGQLRKTLPTYLSNQMPRTYATKPNSAIKYWEARGMTPKYVDVWDAVARRACFVFAQMLPASGGMIIHGDSRHLHLDQLSHRFSWVITSPPYPGMNTYLPDQWLRNWFLGGSDMVEYKDKGQIAHISELAFIEELSQVWRRVALSCEPKAHMVIRFGRLPRYKGDPSLILRRSIKMADSGWRVTAVRSAGQSARGKRQAEQFGHGILGDAADEIDLYAMLEG